MIKSYKVEQRPKGAFFIQIVSDVAGMEKYLFVYDNVTIDSSIQITSESYIIYIYDDIDGKETASTLDLLPPEYINEDMNTLAKSLAEPLLSKLVSLIVTKQIESQKQQKQENLIQLI